MVVIGCGPMWLINNRVLRLMDVDGNQKSGVHQLRLVLYPIIHRVL